MRVALLLALAACGSKATAPDPRTFDKLGAEARCTVTEPRGADCADELLLLDIAALADPELAKGIGDKLGDSHSSGDEARKMHRTHCAASLGYAPAVVACWDVEPCTAFAACVAKHDTATPAK